MRSSMLFTLVTRKFVNCMMWDGKKSLSQKILKKVCYSKQASDIVEEIENLC